MKITGDMDIVYPVGNRLADPDVLQWSIRSVHDNLRDFRHIVIVGVMPHWMDPDTVVHLPVPQDQSKFVNIGNNLLAALDSELVSEDFVWMNDDFFILQRTSELPVFKRTESLEMLAARITKKNYKNANYQAYIKGICGMRDILRAWGEPSPLPNLDHHSPLPIRKHLLRPVIERTRREYPDHVIGHFRSLYRPDEEMVTLLDTKVDRKSDPMPENSLVTSTHRKTWRGELGSWLMRRFSTPSPYEKVEVTA